MARRPRQTTKGTTVENRMGAASITPLCLWSIRDNGQKPCWNLGLECAPLGTPGLGSTTRIRTRGVSPRVFFARWRKSARIRSNCARKMAKTDGANPSVASLDICGSAMSPSGNTSPRLFGPIVSPWGAPGFGSKMRVRTRGFSPRVLLTRWGKLVRSRPRCARKRVQHRRCQPVGSPVGHSGLQCPPLGTPVLGSLGL